MMKRRFRIRLNRRLRKLVGSIFLLSLGAALVQPARSQTGEPPREPMLRIETRMHTAPISRIGVDAANRFLVTASHDKTVRVWELPSGRPLRVLRPPIAAGNEGRLFSVAISPDGQTIAAGGWTGYDFERVSSIYLFDRETGSMVRRITGLPGAINHLVYSRDGRYLAATLGSGGVRVYQTPSYTPAGQDTDYGGNSLGADFDSANRLATTSSDGFIRLYEAGSSSGLRLVAKRRAEGGSQPLDVKFVPDGSRIAVGFVDSSKVNVMSGRDLSPLYTPDTPGINSGNLGSVAWSADGSTLCAGGLYSDANNRKFIRVWTNGGRGGYRDILLDSASTIFHILPLRNGGMIYGAGDPAFGAIDASGRQTLFAGAATADYRALQQGFLVSSDGATVQFGYELFGRSLARFSIASRRLDVPPQPVTGSPDRLQPPLTDVGGLAITGWSNTYQVRLNNQLLTLDPYETARCLAIVPDASAFLLGTEYAVRHFDRNGVERWRVPAPGIAWAVNISADGRLAIAAYGDGTIRWYRMSDGRELLAFFPYRDRKQWLVWTPSGYYDGAPGAEGLIGWHVNNGRDHAADFFPVGQFRETYYRPDVVTRVLQTGDEARALDLANQETGRKQQQGDIAKQLPPVVEIISPLDGGEASATELTIRYRIRTPSGEPVTGVRALVDGRPSGARGLTKKPTADGTGELQVTLPERDSTISLVAENRFAPSVPATVRLKWRERSAPTVSTGAESLAIKPKLYVLAVGISRYANEKYNLQFADKDARDFASVMVAQKGLLYREVVVKTLLNDQATKDEVLDGLDWIRKETTSNDVAMVFFAGHGVNDPNNYYYFCPHNVDPDRLLRTGVAFSDIKNTVSAIAGKALFFVDTCHSGNSLGMSGRRGGLDINIVINDLSSAQNGVIVFSASTGSESSYERAEWNNGAFTKALVEGLSGAADILKKNYITYTMLNVYVADRVKELTKGQQHPTMISPRETVPDFPIAVKR